MDPIKTSDILSLPPLPVSVMKLSKMISDPAIGLKDYSKVIELDPILTASVLRWVNSSWSQSAFKITSIQQAVTRLGTDNILQLALGVHMMSTMRKLLGKVDMTENEIWRHSLATAITTKVLEDEIGLIPPAGAFSAAIIHDIGKILIARHMTYEDVQNDIVKAINEDNLTYLEAETKVMKVNHVALGIDIAEHWKLPEELIEVIANHHHLESGNSLLLTTVQIANGFTKLVDITAGTSSKDIEKQMKMIKDLEINEKQMNKILSVISKEFQKVISSEG